MKLVAYISAILLSVSSYGAVCYDHVGKYLGLPKTWLWYIAPMYSLPDGYKWIYVTVGGRYSNCGWLERRPIRSKKSAAKKAKPPVKVKH